MNRADILAVLHLFKTLAPARSGLAERKDMLAKGPMTQPGAVRKLFGMRRMPHAANSG